MVDTILNYCLFIGIHYTAEIYYEDRFIALLNQDEGLDRIRVEFPGSNVQEDLVLRKVDLAVFENALLEAKRKFQGL